MGQKEIYQYLKENEGKMFTNNELAEKFNINTTSAATSTRKLAESFRIKRTARRKLIKLPNTKHGKYNELVYWKEYEE